MVAEHKTVKQYYSITSTQHTQRWLAFIGQRPKLSINLFTDLVK